MERAMTDLIQTTPLTGPSVWRGADFAADDGWVHHLTAAEIDDLDRALAGVRARGLDFPHIARADFPLPTLSPVLARVADELEDGRGFALLRGLPVEYPWLYTLFCYIHCSFLYALAIFFL